MQRVVSLVSLLFLGSAWTLQGVQALPETLSLTQENFDLGRFMGQWYEVAVVSTCPHYMQRKRGNPVIVALELQHVASQSNFTLTASTFRNGSCKRTSTNYNLTNTPGQFFYHVATGLVHLPPTGAHRSVMQHIANTFLPAGFGADVDSYVVHTNYEEYAMMLLLSTEKPSGNKTTIVKLYSRSVDVSPDVLDNFKTLVSVFQVIKRQSPVLRLRFLFPRGRGEMWCHTWTLVILDHSRDHHMDKLKRRIITQTLMRHSCCHMHKLIVKNIIFNG
ncbi:protein AMBP-like isoform X2 [Xiphias gladius]|uniref:protein AMBP-like isoform X2 n=1 Tax=Xiphias gladius TaxID=8245 RepID=UPI001A994482|nr:protein AMBP-like isoform X2 [Xiphias gladius]